MNYLTKEKYYYSKLHEFFVCYQSENEITNDIEMEAFMASSLEFGIGLSKESAFEDLNFNLAGIGTIKLHS
ncbi:hypothetical protein AUR67_14295 [Pseudoalteromonas sp. XI10]|uniref:hypothetical protein n=1 Tax=Pseudoalteromonas sp. XI10 TaxID=1766621 RepID=UPI00073B6A7D|nr:hypothetical protein [Pseudoalteromonas sp. XI10]KTG19630.1 hypothetical protein AUR67_14295 [Pseudoalteromonas sp. XI10]